MNTPLLFWLELAVPLLLGGLVFAYLQRAIGCLLLDLCGTTARADFWVRISSVLIIAAPTVLVLAFGRGANGASTAAISEILRHALALTVFGIVIAVGVLARAIRKSIPTASHPTSAGDSPCAS